VVLLYIRTSSTFFLVPRQESESRPYRPNEGKAPVDKSIREILACLDSQGREAEIDSFPRFPIPDSRVPLVSRPLPCRDVIP
jgi:hypothetical protein